MSDGNGGVDTATVDITLVNSNPSAQAQTVTAPRQVATAFQLGGTDPNGDSLTYSLASQPTISLT